MNLSNYVSPAAAYMMPAVLVYIYEGGAEVSWDTCRGKAPSGADSDGCRTLGLTREYLLKLILDSMVVNEMIHLSESEVEDLCRRTTPWRLSQVTPYLVDSFGQVCYLTVDSFV
jgi:hypothetical protein